MKKIIIFLAGIFSFCVAVVVIAATTGFLFPTGDGYYTQWTPKTGTTHYTQIDEDPCNGTTDYVYTNSSGTKDSFVISLSSVPNGSIISSIDIVPCASQNKTGATSSVMNVFYRFNGVDSSNSGNYNLSGTVPQVLSTTTFNSLNLVKTSSSTLEIGVVLSSGTKGARLSNIKANLIYDSLPAAPTNLNATSTPMGTSTLVSLSWTDNSNNEDEFRIEKSTNGVDFSLYSTVVANTTSTSVYVFASGYHYFRVKANNSSGESSPSNTVTIYAP